MNNKSYINTYSVEPRNTYIQPNIEIIEFDYYDVIATSLCGSADHSGCIPLDETLNY